MIRTGNNLDQQRQDSVGAVRAPASGGRRATSPRSSASARAEQIDADTQALANSTDSTSSGKPSDVVVIAGADQSP